MPRIKPGVATEEDTVGVVPMGEDKPTEVLVLCQEVVLFA